MSHYVDVHVGRNIRRRRRMTGITQTQLAEAIGIRFQQVQKYETGANRVSASRLFEISQALDVSVAFFFEQIEDKNGELGHTLGTPVEFFQEKETIELINCYFCWPEEQRRYLFALTKSISEKAA